MVSWRQSMFWVEKIAETNGDHGTRADCPPSHFTICLCLQAMWKQAGDWNWPEAIVTDPCYGLLLPHCSRTTGATRDPTTEGGIMKGEQTCGMSCSLWESTLIFP